MKALVLTLVLALSGCTCSNQHGDCIGFDDEPEPGVTYEVSTWNAIWTVLGFETAIAPVAWALTCVKCPVQKAQGGSR